MSLCPQEVGKRDVVIAHVADVTRAYEHTKPPRPLDEAH